MFRTITAFAFIWILSGCSNEKQLVPPASFSSSDTPVSYKLKSHYNEWRGVKYREGGLSKNGVDCSGFVHLTYKHKLNKRIPRSTELLSSTGHKVNKQKLQPGDIVFFKTGWKKRHVGIYTGKGEFIHASSSRGVMKSKLSNPYWSDAYWMARRY